MSQQRLVMRHPLNSLFLKLTNSFLFSITLLALFSSTNSFGAEVAYAGLAYSGDHESIATRFPYSKKFEASLGQAGLNGLLRKSLETVQPQNFTLIPRFDNLAGRDQAIAVALVMTNEVVSVERVACKGSASVATRTYEHY